MNVRRILKWVVIACVIGPPIVGIRYCWFPVTDEIARSVSPDNRWLVVVTRTIYPSIFSDPMQAVRISPAGLSRLWTSAETLAALDERGDKPLSIMFDIRWLDAHTLQVSVSKRAEEFYEKKSRHDDVAIQYATMSGQR